jgi:MFS family permease
MGLGYCLMPLVHSAWQFFLFYSLLVGIGMGGVFVPLISIITRWFKVKRSLMSGLVIAGVSLGMVVISPLASHFISSLGWRNAFLALGAGLAFITIIAAQFLKRDPSTMGQLPDGAQNDSSQEPIEVSGVSFKEALRSYQVWIVFFIFFALGFYLIGNQIFLVPGAIHAGMNSATAALVLSTYGGITLLGLIIFGVVADKMGNKLVFMLCFILCLIASAAIVTNNWPASFFVFSVVAGLARGGLSSSMSPLVASLFGIKSHGVIFGFCGFGNTIGQAVGPYIIGRVVDYNQNYHIAFSVSAVIILIGILPFLLLKPIKKDLPG